MAGNKVKASTILEVLISMVIIIVVFGIAMMIYANVTQSSLSVKKIKAEAVLNGYLQTAEKSTGNTTQSFTVDSLRIEQTIKSYNTEKNLVEIDLVAYDAGQQKVAELHKVIYE
jgi:type II secretory pathway pseudopilin PulG